MLHTHPHLVIFPLIVLLLAVITRIHDRRKRRDIYLP
jgi:hypothetical protein